MIDTGRKHIRGAKLLGSIRELVFGLEDSLVSTLGVVIGVAAGTADVHVVLLSGVVLLVVEALSMTGGSFLSSKSHRQMVEKAVEEQRSDIELTPDKERSELSEMYRERGFSPEEVNILVNRITAKQELWLEEMLAKEFSIGASATEDPGMNAMVMGVSYLFGGILPIIPFTLLPMLQAMIVSTVVTLVALFCVGFMKGRLVAKSGWRSGTEMLIVAGAAVILGYGIGKLAGNLFGIAV